MRHNTPWRQRNDDIFYGVIIGVPLTLLVIGLSVWLGGPS